ncbi:MAG: hypothetical protein QGI21_00175 [Candidatus Poseidoniaceae archaeon]|nr:hypothetical protein [Candidatus Poseidoniaceae archaeon]
MKGPGLVIMLLLSSMTAVLLAPSAVATVSGDLEITESVSPGANHVITSWDPLEISVKVTNSGFFYNLQSRSINWYICEGHQMINNCINDNEAQGTGSIDPLPIGVSTILTFGTSFNPQGDEGNYTVVYEFEEYDSNSSNDYYSTNFRLVRDLVDVEFEEQDLLSQINNLATYQGDLILNTDTNYSLDISGTVTNCPTCNLTAGIGWRILDSNGTSLKEVWNSVQDLPVWGQSNFNRALPDFNYDTEGTYTVEYGLMTSSGDPEGDMNQFNDLQQMEVIFNDTVDLQVTQMYPLNAPSSQDYYYGENSVSATITNLGNHSVTDPLVRFTVYDLEGNIDSEEDCAIGTLHPSASFDCIFDLVFLGDKMLKVAISEMISEGTDAKPSDNIITESGLVIAGDMNPIIDQNNFYGKYNTNQTIEFSVRTAATAAYPVNATWWRAGIIPLGTGTQFNISASVLGLGDHYVSVHVTDSLGELETTSTLITVYNSTLVTAGDWLTGYAVTRTEAVGIAQFDYPHLGYSYGSGLGVEALMIMSIDVIPTTEDDDAGMDWMSLDLNISRMIPDNIPRESISVHQLEDYYGANWDSFTGDNSYTLIDNHTIRLNLTENMDLLMVGELPPADIDSGQPILTPLPKGQMKMDWNVTGEISNPYLGGWMIYRIIANEGGASYFPDPDEITNEYTWFSLMEGNLVATLSVGTETWIDENKLEDGRCVSYVLMPYDRSGIPKPLEGEITRVDGLPGLTCGDAVDPVLKVENFDHEIIYNNNTDCHGQNYDWHLCYELTLSWTWPADEANGPSTWNLYRIENKPSDVNLEMVDPIATNLQNVPGENSFFWQNGTDYDGIRPYRTYYYILAPVDQVGNEDSIANYNSKNVERVYIHDQYWDFNQHRIPEPEPEPEPPYGIEWLGELNDYMAKEDFQLAGVVMILTLMFNFIGLPLILKRRKKLIRVIKKRIARQSENEGLDDFDDFFD